MLALAVVLLASAGARAELPAGVYAVVCGRASRGETRAEAMTACRRAERKERALYRWCKCGENADIVEIQPSEKPKFFVGPCGVSARTREALPGVCRDAIAKAASKCGCDDGPVRAVYGPFKRKFTRREFDDAKVYRFLGDDGEWKDENGTDTCFPSGTPVLTATGERAIETFHEGDSLLSLDENGALVAARVTAVKRRPPQPTLLFHLSNGRLLRATGNHPLRSRGAYYAADTFSVGDILDSVNGEISILSIEDENGAEDLYDLTVAPTRAFIAAGVAVHNY